MVWSWGGDEGGKKLIICLHLPYSLVPCQTKTTTIVLVIKCIKFLLPLQPHMQPIYLNLNRLGILVGESLLNL